MERSVFMQQVDAQIAQLQQVIADGIKNGVKVKKEMSWCAEVDKLPVYYNLNDKPYISIVLDDKVIVDAVCRDVDELERKAEELRRSLKAVEDAIAERRAA